ncbi:MAG: hypothetical protein CMP28_02215 [Roseibacillus sp.]|nr:hypothetical protein [Roseibacillus sp.]
MSTSQKPYLRGFAFLAVLSLSPSLANGETTVIAGEIREFSSPDELNLDPNRVVVAIDVFGDEDRMVNGVLFETDKSPPENVTVTAANTIDGWAAQPSYTGADVASADNLEQIMRDIRWTAAPSAVEVAVSGLTPGIEYELQMLFNEGADRDRRWDIGVEGQLVVDDFSSEGDGTWSPTNGFAYIVPFNLAPGDTTLNVEMKQHIGGQPAMGSDNNPILQAFTVTEITIPPTPESLTLSNNVFFENQTLALGTLTTEDLKRNVTHVYSLEDGVLDNEKFVITDNTIVPGQHDFAADGVGTSYTVRVRTTDADDPTRFLEVDFTLTIVQALAPTGVSFSANSISSGAIVGTPAGQLGTADPNAEDAHVYELVLGSGDDDNDLFTVDGQWLRVAGVLPGGGSQVSLRVRSTDLAGLSVEQTFALDVTEPSLRINEILASNGGSHVDEDNDESDWLELFNEQAGAASMNGWYLTDDPDNLTKWQFPAVTLAANEHLVIFASGKDRRPANGNPLHTSFQLDSGGEFLALVMPDGVTIASQVEFPGQFVDTSYGVDPAGRQLGYFQVPTPGSPNSDFAEQIVNEVSFSQERGFYRGAFELTLSATIPGSAIRYTTNGSKPTPSSGSIYNGSLRVSPDTSPSTRGTRRVRAIAVHPTAAMSPVATHTFIFVDGTRDPGRDGVVGQSIFQSSIKNHEVYGPLMNDGLQALPAISIIKSGGVSSSETETSIELISNDGSERGFQVDCGIKLVGGASVGSPKNNFRCYFRSQYGEPKLRYPLFANHPYSGGASEVFDVIQLRSASHDNFYWMGRLGHPPSPFRDADALYIRNRFTWDVEMLMGHTSIHGRWAHCYLNGVYHGIYQIHERPMHHYLDKYLGGDPEDYHYTNSGRTGSDHGGGDSWNNAWNEVRTAASAPGEISKDWISWESLADNQLLYFYFGNDWDWSSRHNWMAAGPKNAGEGGWRFYSWDCDVSMYDVNENNLGRNTPDGVFPTMMNNEEFRVYFRDRVFKHCFHDGVLRADGLRPAFDYRIDELRNAIVPETARWQPSNTHSAPWDRDGEWQVEIDYMRDTFFPGRTTVLLDQLRDRGWYPVEAPEFTPRGGPVNAGFSPVIDSPSGGTIYLTTDGGDPRLPGGAVNPGAEAFNGSSNTTTVIPRDANWKYLDDGTDQGPAWRSTTYPDENWAEGPAELGYGDNDEQTQVSWGSDAGAKQITTYFRRRFDVRDAAEVSAIFMEMKRDDGAVVYLNGTEVWRSNMPDGVVSFDTLALEGQRSPGEHAWYTKNDVPVNLLVDGENTLAVEVHQILPTSSDLTFNFSLALTVPTSPSRFSIEESTVIKARVLQNGQWSPIHTVSYTIGPPADGRNLAVTEFSYRPKGATSAEDPGGLYSRVDFEFVEMRNISDETIHLNDVRFTNGITFDFRNNPLIGLGPGENVLLVENMDAFRARYPTVSSGVIAGEYDGNLSNDGERIEIRGFGDTVIRAFTYNDKLPWPEAPDGDGYSLELINPGANPDHGVAENWRASRGIHGTPDGVWTVLNFADWQGLNFTAEELENTMISGPDADQDSDGRSNFFEFALGDAPDDQISRKSFPQNGIVREDGKTYLSLTYTEWLGAGGVAWVVEHSEDLASWQDGPSVVKKLGSSLGNLDGTVSHTFRSTIPLEDRPKQFMRLRVSN